MNRHPRNEVSTPGFRIQQLTRVTLLVLLFLFPGMFGPVPGVSATRTDVATNREAGPGQTPRPEALERAVRKAGSMRHLRSLIISWKGRVVARQYYRGMKPGRPVNIKSASKSVISALVGIAIDQGHLQGLDQTIDSFFHEMLQGEDPRKRNITLRDLLLMRSGLRSTSFGRYGAWVTSDNWARWVLKQPLRSTPGTSTKYSTGNSHLVAVMLARAVDQDLRIYAQNRLFDALGVRIQGWQRDPQGYRFGGNNMALKPRGLHRFGELYLNQGRWEGQQVISREWVRTSTTSYVEDTFHGFAYGYYWWIESFRGVRVHFAWGHGGQYVFIAPELDLVVTTTSSLASYSGNDLDYSERVRSF